MRGGLHIDGTREPRWGLALDLVESGEDSVEFRDSLNIRREVGFPEADGKIHFTVWVPSKDPDYAQAQAHLNHARGLVADITDDDERFASLIKTYGAIWELAHDYGTGSILVGRVSDDGVVVKPAAY